MAGIHEAICKIMTDIVPVAKDRSNDQQHYKFRGVDDVYNALQPLLAKYGVFSVPEVLEERSEERTTQRGGVLIYRILRIRYTFFAGDGSSIQATVVGEGMDSGDKASNKAMAVAHKYACLQIFAIPTADTKDPEAESPEVAPKQAAPTKLTARPKPVAPTKTQEPPGPTRKSMIDAIALLMRSPILVDDEEYAQQIRARIKQCKTVAELETLRRAVDGMMRLREGQQDIEDAADSAKLDKIADQAFEDDTKELF